MNRVAITGLGIVSCLGRGADAVRDALRNGRSGIRTLSIAEGSNLTCRIGGEIPGDLLEGGDRNLDRFAQLAQLAADDAVADAQIAGAFAPERTGVVIGTGLGGCETMDAAYKRLYAESGRVHPMTIALSMYNAGGAAISMRHTARGPSWSVVSACASATHAIGAAAQLIRSGAADVMFTGGADSPLVYGIVRAWESMRVLAVDNDNPAAACRPFSLDRKGLVLAEGAAVFILESWSHAEARGARIVGEVLGSGSSSDAAHITAPASDGAARAMAAALQDAQLTVDDVDYINAHGTATKANDATETQAIRTLFGERAHQIPVSSTKSMHGHAMGASGAIELACSLIALRAGFLPPTINLDARDPGCDLDYVANEARETNARTFLSNSFAFGGSNGVLGVRVQRTED